MFRKSVPHKQGNFFSSVPSILEGKSLNQYNDTSGWHNQFRKQIVSRIDETIFGVLFSQKMGAPNSPVSLLVGMMVLKEAFGWSDSQLFEQCRFNLLVRSALGMFNLSDEVPADSTYYLLRQKMYQHKRLTNEDLLQKAFEAVTHGQVKAFEVSGKSIRIDSKLIGSNIAWYSRYEIIHKTVALFFKTLDSSELQLFSEGERQHFSLLLAEEPQKTIYRSTKDDILERVQAIGILAYRTLMLFQGKSSEAYQLLQRVFGEQYKVVEGGKKIELRPKEEIETDSVQSPHDPDSAYRQKSGQKIKGYSMNVTETISDGHLDLITNVIVEKANVADTAFVQPAISSTQAITGTPVEKVYSDGAYQSPDNDGYCQDIDMVFTGIQGAASRYDLEMTPDGLMVTDTKTGEQIKATLAKKTKNSTDDRWYIRSGKDKVYFNQQAIRTSHMRRSMKQRPKEELQKRNNVEATMFHVAYPLRSGKSKYRGLVKVQAWAICRCLWVNLVRIIHFIEQTCQRPFQKTKNAVHALRLWAQTKFIAPTLNLMAPKLSVFSYLVIFMAFIFTF